MSIKLEEHIEILLILPLLAYGDAECETPGCCEVHDCVTIGWLLWSIHITF